jgi:hypothetical protein
MVVDLNDGPRSLRDGEFPVDCGKARVAFEGFQGPHSEDRAAYALGISRSVLRRILGKEGSAGQAIVNTANARSFAEKCGIDLDAIRWSDHTDGLAAADSIPTYLRLWREVYGLGLGPLVPLTMHYDDVAIDANGILGLLEKNQTVQLCGGSGCGKSHLLTHLTIRLPDLGFAPVFLRAADFAGDLDWLLNRAVSTVAPLSFDQLVRGCRTRSRDPIVILDAINECPSSLRTLLFAALQKLRTQFDFPVILSNQSQLVLPPSLGGPVIKISPPSRAEKQALVAAYLGRGIPEDNSFSLEVISSAQDAMVWAQVFAQSDLATSRFALYESYVRCRLAGGQYISGAQRALALLAYEMRQSFVFSVPEATVHRVIDRVISSPEHADGVRLLIERSGLVPITQGRGAFKHELLQDFFATEELLRIASLPQTLGQALSKPIHSGLAEFAVGALAGGMEVAATLSELHDTALISACVSGRCGPIAKQYVVGECNAALERLGQRYCAVTFDLPKNTDRFLSADLSAAPSFNTRDAPYLAAAMSIFPEGGLLSPVLNMIRCIDNHIEDERLRLRACYPDKKIAWRADIFTSMYCLPYYGGPDEFRVSLQAARMRGLWQDAKDTYDRISSLLSGFSSLTPGKLYFLIESFHSAYTREVAPPTFLYDLAQRAWSFHIYHLQLATTHMLTLHCHNLPDSERQRFIALAEGWLDNNDPVMNSCIIDVLKVLDALGDQFTPADAQKEFEEALACPASPEANEHAFSLYCRLFDHPYDAAYAEAFYDLSEERREALLLRAAQTGDVDSMFFGFLLIEIAKHPTMELAPALRRAAIVPNANTTSIHESIRTFVASVVSLAKLSVPLDDDDHPDVLRKAWHSMRNILHLMHTPGMTQAEYVRVSDRDWTFIESEHLLDYPMRIVRDRWLDTDETSVRLLEWSKDRLLRMSRAALVNPRPPRSWFAHPHRESELFREHVEFALSILEMYGDRSDLPAITALIESQKFGTSALKAARGIESR